MSDFPSYDLYAELGVAPDATKASILKSWKQLQRTMHPDKQTTAAGKKLATEKSTRLNAAKEVLTDDHLRAEYDQTRSCKNADDAGYAHTTSSRTRETSMPPSSYCGANPSANPTCHETEHSSTYERTGTSNASSGQTRHSRRSSSSRPMPNNNVQEPFVDPRASFNPFVGQADSQPAMGTPSPPRSNAGWSQGRSASQFPDGDNYTFKPAHASHTSGSPPASPGTSRTTQESYFTESPRPTYKRAGTWATGTQSRNRTAMPGEEPSFFSGTGYGQGRRASAMPSSSFRCEGSEFPNFSGSRQCASIFDDEISDYATQHAFRGTMHSSRTRPVTATRRSQSSGRGLLGGDGGFCY